MPTIKILPSTYYLSNSSYLSISNASNMYTNTDSDTYATITNSQNGTTSYYIYLRGFDFSQVPTGAIINSFSIKLKVRETGVTTSTSYRPYLCNNASLLTSTASMPSTSVNTITFSGYSFDWDTMVEYGSNFGIRINCRRASRSTTAYMYIYGAEIEVDYTLSIYHTLTIQDNGFNVTPTGTIEVLENSIQRITIDETTLPNVTLDGTDITNQFNLVTLDTSYSGVPSSSSYTSLQSGGTSVSTAVGYSAESPSSNTTCWYSTSSATVDSCYAEYTFDLSNVPSTAINIIVTCTIAGAAESSTYSHQSSGGRYSVWALCSNGTEKSEQIYTTNTSTTTLSFSDTGSWTRDELNNLQLRHYVGYYGGRTNGVTLNITYTLPGSSQVYIYNLTITSDHTIILSNSTVEDIMYIKQNGSFVQVTEVYEKVDGSWVKQTDLQSIYDDILNNFYKIV